MNDAQLAITILTIIFLFIYVVSNFSDIGNYKLYKKKYQEMQRGMYKFEPNRGSELIYFNLYSYNINTLEFHRTNCDIIFFPDGDIKLTENLYIHKSHLFMSLHTWYYWRKFQKLKNHLIQQHNFRESYRRMDGNHYERYMKQQIKKEFKFFRG